MQNLRQTINKLQMALCIQGTQVRIAQYRTWSSDKGRMVTKYMVSEKRIVDSKPKYVAVCETYRQIEVVQMLADMLKNTAVRANA